jgi:hypothetical protein
MLGYSSGTLGYPHQVLAQVLPGCSQGYTRGYSQSRGRPADDEAALAVVLRLLPVEAPRLVDAVPLMQRHRRRLPTGTCRVLTGYPRGTHRVLAATDGDALVRGVLTGYPRTAAMGMPLYTEYSRGYRGDGDALVRGVLTGVPWRWGCPCTRSTHGGSLRRRMNS